jgi:hypothetical protein
LLQAPNRDSRRGEPGAGRQLGGFVADLELVVLEDHRTRLAVEDEALGSGTRGRGDLERDGGGGGGVSPRGVVEAHPSLRRHPQFHQAWALRSSTTTRPSSSTVPG